MVILKHHRKGINSTASQTALYIALGFIIVCVMAPVIITVLFSLKTPLEHLGSIWVLPKTPMVSNYVSAILALYKNMLNSLLVCIITTLGVVFFSSASAYVFARHKFPLKEVFFSLVIALMIVPSVLTMTPQYLNILNLGLKNTRLALILPGIAGGQVGAIFLFRTFFNQQPADLYESATLDGANDFVMYLKITLPLAVPILIIQAIGTFSALYNDFLWPTLVINKPEIQTLMPRLKYLAEMVTVTNPGLPYAMYIVSGIPVIILSLVGLKFFINGDFASGMKL